MAARVDMGAAGNPAAQQALARQALAPKAPSTPSGEDPEAIREAARQFESVFMHQVFKTMRATVPKEGLLDTGFGGQVFTDMLDQEYAELASRNGQVGLAGIIAEQLGAPRTGALRPGSTVGMRARAAQIYAAQATARAEQTGRIDGAGISDPSREAWVMPVDGRVSSRFGLRKLADEDHARQHRGLDIAAPTGTPIRAARAGTVSFAGRRGGFGNTVVVDHGQGVSTLYAHASTIDVNVGDRVRAGAPIAKVGSTGRSTGPHLHFEIRRDGEAVDPAGALRIAE